MSTSSGATLSRSEQRALADRVKQLRAERGLSMAQLAAEIGHSQSSISLLESGHMPAPTMRMMAALARYFGVGIDSLVKQDATSAVSPHNVTSVPHYEELSDMTERPRRPFSTRHGDQLVLMVPAEDTDGRPHADRLVLVVTADGRQLCRASEAATLTVEAVEVSRWSRSG